MEGARNALVGVMCGILLVGGELPVGRQSQHRFPESWHAVVCFGGSRLPMMATLARTRPDYYANVGGGRERGGVYCCRRPDVHLRRRGRLYTSIYTYSGWATL